MANKKTIPNRPGRLKYHYQTCIFGSNCQFFRLLRHYAHTNRLGQNIDVAERHYGLFAGLGLAENGKDIVIAMLYSADICNDSLTSAVCFADDTLSEKSFKLTAARRQV
jgi:hypothetical protein